MSEAKGDVMTYVMILFILLGGLFGMQILNFVFAVLTPADLVSFVDDRDSIINETGGYVNVTGYTLAVASLSTFKGSINILAMINATNNAAISSGNYTLNTETGLITNATAVDWQTVKISYNFLTKGDQQVRAEHIQNNSLNGIETYTEGADTQFNTLTISITLILLIGLFVIFWKLVMSEGLLTKKTSGNFS